MVVAEHAADRAARCQMAAASAVGLCLRRWVAAMEMAAMEVHTDRVARRHQVATSMAVQQGAADRAARCQMVRKERSARFRQAPATMAVQYHLVEERRREGRDLMAGLA